MPLVVLAACAAGPAGIPGPTAAPAPSTSTSTPRGDDPTEDPDSPVSVEQVIETFTETSNMEYTREPWRKIAVNADLVVLGVVVRSGPGRIVGIEPDDPYAEHFATAQVRATHIARNLPRHPVRIGDRLWVEFNIEADAIDAGLRPGMRIGLLLSDLAWVGTGTDVDNSQSIVPDDAPLWVPTSLRGILVEPVAGRGFVVPHDGLVHPSETIARFLDLIAPPPVQAPVIQDPRGIRLPPYYGPGCDRVGLAGADC